MPKIIVITVRPETAQHVLNIVEECHILNMAVGEYVGKYAELCPGLEEVNRAARLAYDELEKKLFDLINYIEHQS